jgi:pyrroline-5-carboxylate reductase
MSKQLTYAFVGAGNMSGAILGGMVKSGFDPKQIIAVNRSKEKQDALHQQFGVVTHLSALEAVNQADVVILGVKPQMMLSVLEQLVKDGADFSGKLVITVAAGLHCERYLEAIGNVRFIRCMPNTPSLVGLGVAGLFMGTDTSVFSTEQLQQDKAVTSAIFSAVGEAIWLEKESDIDTLAAVSGSGPAYFFMFMEYMESKAKQMGYSDDVARIMVQQTALGASQMAANSEKSFATLRENVTSPGGSTAEALRVFNE